MATINGTPGNDTLSTTSGSDTVNAGAGNDWIYGSLGTDVINGGDGYDRIQFLDWLHDTGVTSGPMSFTVTDSKITNNVGNINSTISGIEAVSISFVGMDPLDPGRKFSVDARNFSGSGGVDLDMTFGDARKTDGSFIGSNQDDRFTVGGGIIDVDGLSGSFDYLTISLVDDSAETVSLTRKANGDVVLASSSGTTITAKNIEIFSIHNGQNYFPGPPSFSRNVDWSALDIGITWFDPSSSSNFADDTVIGGAGDDAFQIGFGSDTYTGGAGADTYRIYDPSFAPAWSETTSAMRFDGDTITDLASEDRIDLSGVTFGGAALSFIGNAAFSGKAGEVRYVAAGGKTLVQGDADGDGTADATLTIANGAFAIGETVTGSMILRIIPAANQVTGTPGNDAITNVTQGDDIVDAGAGDDVIYASSGSDTIDGGSGYDQVQVWLDNPGFKAVVGSRTITIGDSSLTDSSGDIATQITGVESVAVGTIALPLLPAGQGYVLDASAFTGIGGVFFDVLGTADTLIGSSQNDRLNVRGGTVDVSGGSGFDYLNIGLTSLSPETVTVSVDSDGDVIFSSTSGSVITGRDIEEFFVYNSRPSAKTVDWSGTDIAIYWYEISEYDGFADDTIIAGSGDDRFDLGLGTNTYTGGAGADRYFIYQLWDDAADSGGRFDGDTVTDFALDDRIDFSNVARNNAFEAKFIGDSEFSGKAGEIRYRKANGKTTIESDGDGDGKADAVLVLANGEFDLAETEDGSAILMRDSGGGNSAPVFAVASAAYAAVSGTGLVITPGVIDPDGDDLTYTVGPVSHGSVAINDDGTLVYSADAGFSGSDSFVLTASDGTGGTAQQTITVAVAATQAAQDYRLFAASGFVGEVGGSGTILGTLAVQDIAILEATGSVSFDPSFNRGGDIIRLSGDARDYSIHRSGSSVILTDGALVVSLPVGTAGTAIAFADGIRELRFDTATASVKIGGQSVLTNSAAITEAPTSAEGPSDIDPGAVARVLLVPGGEVTLGGNYQAFGTDQAESLVYLQGDLRLDPSFNRGGDTLRFEGDADEFSARLNGSSVILMSSSGEIIIPVGTAGMTLDFGGDQRVLRYSAEASSVLIDDQAITSSNTMLIA